ncbi:hypothetical protein OIU77_003646, partial [Salix suchowensis]
MPHKTLTECSINTNSTSI